MAITLNKSCGTLSKKYGVPFNGIRSFLVKGAFCFLPKGDGSGILSNSHFILIKGGFCREAFVSQKECRYGFVETDRK